MFSAKDMERLVQHVNGILQEDRLINMLVPGAVPTTLMREEHLEGRRRLFQALENQTLVLKAARRLGCTVVNMEPIDLVRGNMKLLHSILWQIVKNGLLHSASSLSPRPTSDAQNSPRNGAELNLLRWINSTIGANIGNLGKDLVDGNIYALLLHHFYPEQMSLEAFRNEPNKSLRIQQILHNILGDRCILRAEDISEANEAMNTLCLATMFRRITLEISKQKEADRGVAAAEQIASLQKQLREAVETIEMLRLQLEAQSEGEAVSDHYVDPSRANAIDKSDESQCVTFGQDCHLNEANSGRETFALFIGKERGEFREITADSSGAEGSEAEEGKDQLIPVHDIPVHEMQISSNGDGLANRSIRDTLYLKTIYSRSKDIRALAMLLYASLGAYKLSTHCTLAGWLHKEGFWGTRWTRRYAIIKDNLILFYKDDHSSSPSSVHKLDECQVSRLVHDRNAEKHVLQVMVASQVDPHRLLISVEAQNLLQWHKAISKASLWWATNKP